MISHTTIQEWLIRINGAEGGYADRNIEDDPGGETKWGISKRSYPYLDIRNLTLNDAAIIYRRDFILPLASKDLSRGVTYQLLDFAVHSGIPRAIKSLQAELRLKPDGIVGDITRAKISSTSDSDLVQLIIAARLEFLTTLPNWPSNSRGWCRRMAKNLRYGAIDTE